MYKYKNLLIIRKQNNLSQEQIAQILDIKQEQYQRYESGKREIPIHLMKQLAKYYGVSMDYLTEE